MTDGRCAKCGQKLDPFADSGAPNTFHVDHVVPRSMHGLDHISNYQPLCSSCNTAKGNKSTEDYRSDAVRAKFPAPSIPEAVVAGSRIEDADQKTYALMKKFGDDAVIFVVTMYRGTPGSKGADGWRMLKEAVETHAPQKSISLNNKGDRVSLSGEEWAELMSAAPAIDQALRGVE